MLKMTVLVLTILGAAVMAAGQGRSWVIQLEEPTGIERRDNEAVRFVVRFAAGQARAEWLRVVDEEAHEVPVQVVVSRTHPDGSIASAEILFPATLIPGSRPRYRLLASPLVPSVKQPGQRGGDYLTDIVVRRLGTSRLEIGNSRFSIIVNLGKDNTTPAIVEAYNRTSGEHRMLNLVETTPDLKEDLKFGIRSAGWGTALNNSSSADRTSGFTNIDIVESGPLRGRVRLSGARLGASFEVWEIEWYARSPVLIWRARTEARAGNYGFYFSAISAFPYEPFTHWAGGAEVGWPDGDTNNPPHKAIITPSVLIPSHNLDDLPGGHVLYYNPQENYGALDFIEADLALRWFGVGSRQFYAYRQLGGAQQQPPKAGMSAITRPQTVGALADWSSQIAIAFPTWKGSETLLDARACYRRFAQPILAHSLDPQPLAKLPAYTPAPRTASYRVDEGPATGNRPGFVELALDGSWKLQHAEKGEGEEQRLFEVGADDSTWQEVRVPGSVHTQILKYPAYYTHEAEWISFKEWWYRKQFRVPAAMKGKPLRLQFDATDYYADIWLNGKQLGRHEGYVDPYEFDVADKVNLDGENVLAVRVWTPVDYYWRHRPYTIKGSYGAVDQKPDDITPVGITRSVRLVANHSAVIDTVVARPSLNPDGSADVDVEVALRAAQMEGRVELTLAPRNFSSDQLIRATVNLDRSGDQSTRQFAVRLHIDKPQLWWTWDHGKPNLYTLSTRILVDDQVSDTRSQAVGIREIEKVGWIFYLNGRRMYIRGTNSYYLELFLSEMTREKYERDIDLMKSMNINMIRLHCHFQNPEFYDRCDEVGILVWQDFLEAWYPHDKEYALQAARLYDAHIQMVRNHPCVAIWATSDEEDLENYRVLTKHLAGRLFAGDQEHRAIVRSTGRYGDGHIYYGWYGGSIWQYISTEEQFISELGATALPNYETLMEFLPDHWPIEDHREEWIFRKLQISEAMRAWGSPVGKSLKDYIPQTQAYVARLHQLAIERMRRRKYDAGGILHFHAIDFWPSVTMAALDYFRRPTKSYFTVQRSFQMVLASLEYDRDVWRIGEEVSCGLWIINDHWYSIEGARIKWRIVDSGGAATSSGEVSVNIAEDSSVKLDQLRWKPAAAGRYELRAEVFDREGKRLSENLYEFEVR